MNWRRASIAGAIALPIIALLAYGTTRDPKAVPSQLPGRQAPDFALPIFAKGEASQARAEGDTVRLSQFQGQVVVLNFWASWCLPCRAEHRALSDAAVDYEKQGVKFLGVLYDDTPDNGKRWIVEMGGQPYPSLEDSRKRTAIDYGLYGVPETFFIGRDGRVAYKHIGPVTDALLAAKLDSLLATPREP
ncbi:MAG: redoxin domain-containing protein [Gemmatimonadaceae bacterium]|nr:redoxin domain-containing protein [Gemmatimonadaceae bacterium]